MDNNNQIETKSVDLTVGGEMMGTKIVVPKSVNYNDQSRRVNFHLNDRDVVSISTDNLEKWANVKLSYQPGGKKEEPKEIEANGSLDMRYTGEKEGKRFFHATKFRFDRNRDTCEVHLGENHRIDVGQSRFKNMGLKIEPDFKSRSVER